LNAEDVIGVLLWLPKAKNKELLGEAGIAGPMVEVLKSHLLSAGVMEKACWALGTVADDGELRKERYEYLKVQQRVAAGN